MSPLRSYVITLSSGVAPVAFALLSTPILIRACGLAGYGLIALVWSIVAYLQFLDFGVGRALNRLISMEGASDKDAELVGSALTCLLFIALPVSTILFLVTLLLQNSSGRVGEFASTLSDNIVSVSLLLISILVTAVAVSFLEAKGKYGGSNIILIVSSFLFNICPLPYAILVDSSASGVVLFGSILRFLFLVPTILLCWSALAWRPLKFNPKVARRLLGYGGWLAITNLVTPVLETADRLIAGLLIGPVGVAYQAIVYNIVRAVRIIPLSYYRVLFPIAARGAAQTTGAAQRSLIDGFAPLMATVCVWATAFLRPSLTWWISPEVGAATAPLGAVMLAGLSINAVAIIPYATLQAQGRAKVVAGLGLTEMIPYVVLLAIAMKHFGVLGAAVAWSLRVVVDALLLFRISGVKSIKRSDIVLGGYYSLNVVIVLALPAHFLMHLLAASSTTVLLIGYYYWVERDIFSAWTRAVGEIAYLARKQRA